MRTWITAAALGAAVLGGFASVGAAAQASAAPAPAPTAPADRDGDGDGDGVTTREEAAADADRRFAAMDANHDGKLTGDERRAWREQHRPPPRRMGGKRDEAQTQAAFRDHALRRFDRIDTNHDGRIDAQERAAARLLMRARRIGHDRGAAPADPADPSAPTG